MSMTVRVAGMSAQAPFAWQEISVTCASPNSTLNRPYPVPMTCSTASRWRPASPSAASNARSAARTRYAPVSVSDRATIVCSSSTMIAFV